MFSSASTCLARAISSNTNTKTFGYCVSAPPINRHFSNIFESTAQKGSLWHVHAVSIYINPGILITCFNRLLVLLDSLLHALAPLLQEVFQFDREVIYRVIYHACMGGFGSTKKQLQPPRVNRWYICIKTLREKTTLCNQTRTEVTPISSKANYKQA